MLQRRATSVPLLIRDPSGAPVLILTSLQIPRLRRDRCVATTWVLSVTAPSANPNRAAADSRTFSSRDIHT